MTYEERARKVEENLGLVHACARRFTGKGTDYEDIVSAGCIGLIKAIDNFEETKGVKLSTYAVPAILGEIKRIWRDGGSIKISRSIKELSLKATKLNQQNIKLTGKELTVSELSVKLGVSVDEITEALSAAELPVSLSMYIDDEEKEYQIPTASHEEKLTEKLSLQSAVNSLDSFDKKLVILRYYKGKTQSETAKILNTSQVQISRKERKILAAIKKMLL